MGSGRKGGLTRGAGGLLPVAQGAADKEFKYVPAKRRSFYHFNSEPSATAKNEEKARMKMREQCG